MPQKKQGQTLFYDGYAVVKKNGKCGFINEIDEEVGKIKYDFVWRYKNGYAVVKLNNKYGFIDKYGREICPIKYSLLSLIIGK